MKKHLLIATAALGLFALPMSSLKATTAASPVVEVSVSRKKRGGGGNGGQIKCFSRHKMNLSREELKRLEMLCGRAKKIYVKELKEKYNKRSRTEELLAEIRFENRKRL